MSQTGNFYDRKSFSTALCFPVVSAFVMSTNKNLLPAHLDCRESKYISLSRNMFPNPFIDLYETTPPHCFRPVDQPNRYHSATNHKANQRRAEVDTEHFPLLEVLYTYVCLEDAI